MVSTNAIQPFNEAYEVARTVEVTAKLGGSDRRIRIDALHDLKQPGTFSTRAYMEEDFRLTPTYPAQGLTGAQPYQIWVAYDLPWTDRTTADDAIDQALGFLAERHKP